jgi:AcrR family transcriptional regulator
MHLGSDGPRFGDERRFSPLFHGPNKTVFATNNVLDERCSLGYRITVSEEAPRKIISRRNRPAKAPLSRDAIVSTALDILERDGLSGLSLRRVAAALDTGAASLYVYVANLEELHALMLDQALGAVQVTEAGSLPWRDRLKTFLLAYLHVLYSRPGLAQLALSTIAAGTNSLRIWETLLGLLKEGEVDDLRAAWGIDLLTLYVTAIAAEQSVRRESDEGLGRVKNALSNVSEKQFPLVFASKETLLSGGGETRGDWALDVIINGIAGVQLQRSAPAATRPTKQRGRGSKK